jgi:DNA-binding GntR family transcriptional regulator
MPAVEDREPRLWGSERVGEAVYRQLRQWILDGRLPPGSRLSVPAIARELGVSRSPVRDAVLHLVREGLGQETLNRGAVVRTIGRQELANLYEAGEALEGMAARLAAHRCGPALRRRLSELLDMHRQVVVSDVSRDLELEAAFHREIRTAAANPVLSRMLDEIHGQVMLATRASGVTGGLAHAVEDHGDVLEAILSGDVEASEAAARRHVSRLRKIFTESSVVCGSA